MYKATDSARALVLAWIVINVTTSICEIATLPLSLPLLLLVVNVHLYPARTNDVPAQRCTNLLRHSTFTSNIYVNVHKSLQANLDGVNVNNLFPWSTESLNVSHAENHKDPSDFEHEIRQKIPEGYPLSTSNDFPIGKHSIFVLYSASKLTL